MKSPGVYRIHCKINKKNYIGSSSKDWANRRNGHMFLLKAGKHTSKAMQKDWNDFGSDAFRFILICECGADRVLELERAAMIEWDSLNPEKGYNTSEISVNRFRSGRKSAPADRVRFSRYLPRDKAKKLIKALEVDDWDIVFFSHGLDSGIKTGAGCGSKTTELQPERTMFKPCDFDKPEEMEIDSPTEKELPMPLATMKDAEISKLKSRVAMLESKIREYETMYG